jgi:hypothetical protein
MRAEAPGARAAEATASDAAARPGRGSTWFALPVVFWLPETSLGVAAAAGVHFHVAPGAGDSNAFLVAGASLEGQSTVDFQSDVALAGGTVLAARLRAAYYPDRFYGIGPTTTLADREDMTRRFAEAIFVGEYPLLRRLRAGLRLHGRVEDVIDVQPGGLLASGTLPGSSGYAALGVGAQATWDTRDRPLWPERGAFAQAWYVRYPASLGRNAGFGRGAAEGRLFVPFRGPVLALGALVEAASGGTPVTTLPRIGSTRYLRGIREGRFRDQLAWATQAEIRVPLTDRIASVAFLSVGDVAPGLSSLRLDTLKVAGGGGARFRVTEGGARVRVDVATGGVETAFYVLLLEAF